MANGGLGPILLVEDSPEDYVATLRALRNSGLEQPLIRVEDGDEALDYLFGRGKFEDTEENPRPSLVLLDLNLPGTDGFEVLREIKADESLRRIPVIVLTTSSDDRDVQRCYDRGANTFIRKPVDLSQFVEAMAIVHRFWMEIAILPDRVEHSHASN